METDSDSVINGCWAAALGNCGGGISNEHLVSECLFKDQSVFVHGLDWCLDKSKQVRIERLTAKILCKDHNSALSSLDAAAGNGFDLIRDAAKLSNDRGKMPNLNWAPKQFTINGPLLERWFLKTLLNFSFNRHLIIGPGNHAAGVVPDYLVKVVFGHEQFSDGCGLYTAFRAKETFKLEQHFGFTAKARGANLVMGSFRFHGYRFYLNLLPERFTGIEESEVFYRQTHFAWEIGGRFSHRLSIVWPKVPLVATTPPQVHPH